MACCQLEGVRRLWCAPTCSQKRAEARAFLQHAWHIEAHAHAYACVYLCTCVPMHMCAYAARMAVHIEANKGRAKGPRQRERDEGRRVPRGACVSFVARAPPFRVRAWQGLRTTRPIAPRIKRAGTSLLALSQPPFHDTS